MITYLEKNNVKRVHFIGVGGVSMNVLAKYTVANGYTVSGSDIIMPENHSNDKILFQSGHKPTLVKYADLVVYTSAVNNDNEEIAYCLKSGKRLISRSEYLSQVSNDFGVKIGVAGCHGKTTVSCMLEEIFKAHNAKFFAHIGGTDRKFGNFVYTGNDYLISEVCEYKRNIRKYDSDVSCILNIAPDHMDCYDGLEDLVNEYYRFANRSKLAVVNADDVNCVKFKGNKITFGLSEISDYRAVNIVNHDGKYSFDIMYCGNMIASVKLNVYGRHNVYNALAAFTVSQVLKIPESVALEGLNAFTGAKRRFEKLSESVIADYAHHPDEIRASIKTVKEFAKGKVYVVFQPHTYSRTKLLFGDFLDCFNGVENLYVYKTYSAREKPTDGFDGEYLSKYLPSSRYYTDADKMFDDVLSKVTAGDVVLVLGAGDIYYIAKDYLNKKSDAV